jgi:TM2 domain-containing membrane protein YozV
MTQYTPPSSGSGLPPDIANKKLIAGILGILLGGLGIHKFYLGMTTPGIILLVLGLVSCGSISGIVGLIEGIIYLTKSDADFYQTYVVGQKQWF